MPVLSASSTMLRWRLIVLRGTLPTRCWARSRPAQGRTSSRSWSASGTFGAAGPDLRRGACGDSPHGRDGEILCERALAALPAEKKRASVPAAFHSPEMLQASSLYKFVQESARGAFDVGHEMLSELVRGMPAVLPDGAPTLVKAFHCRFQLFVAHLPPRQERRSDLGWPEGLACQVR